MSDTAEWLADTGETQRVFDRMLEDSRVGSLVDLRKDRALLLEGSFSGGGVMPALGVDGRIYPCFRFLPHTQEQGSPLVCGDVERGLWNKRAFSDVCKAAYRCNCTSKRECRECECESACAYCIAGCYSEYGEFRRQTHICQITQIQVEFARKYWAKIDGGKNP